MTKNGGTLARFRASLTAADRAMFDAMTSAQVRALLAQIDALQLVIKAQAAMMHDLTDAIDQLIDAGREQRHKEP